MPRWDDLQWWWWYHRRTFVAKARVVVMEASTSSADSFTTGFTPEAGAIMGAPAGFVIMVTPSCTYQPTQDLPDSD